MMFKKFYPLALASLLGAAAFAIPGSSSFAAAIPYVQQTSGEVNSGSNLLQQEIRHRRGDRRHGHRYNRHRGYNSFSDYNGGYDYGLRVGPLFFGAYDDDDNWRSNRHDRRSNRHWRGGGGNRGSRN